MLELKNISAYYGDSPALHDVSLVVSPGTAVAVLGRNGAGKSTLFKSIAGGDPKVQGEILLNKTNLVNMPPYQRIRTGISFVPEDRRIFPHLTVAENLELARHGVSVKDKYLDLKEICELFPLLNGLLDRKGTQLSGGQQQVVAVARGMVTCPEFLLLDEPTEGVAPLIVQQMAEQIQMACKQQGITLVVAEQNVWFARTCSQYVNLMDTGQIVFSGSWEEYDENPSLAEKYLAV